MAATQMRQHGKLVVCEDYNRQGYQRDFKNNKNCIGDELGSVILVHCIVPQNEGEKRNDKINQKQKNGCYYDVFRCNY